MRSSKAALSSRSMPGRTLSPLKVGIRNFRRCAKESRRERVCRRLSSIRAVKVVPFSAANFFASVKSRGSRRTVVLMHQDISYRHQYVKTYIHVGRLPEIFGRGVGGKLRGQPVKHTRKRNCFADVVKAADPGDHAFDAHAEAGVGDGAVAAQVEIPLKGLARELVLLQSPHE